MSAHEKYLILGRGYTGRVLEKRLREKIPSATLQSTNRRGTEHAIAFDLLEPATWNQVPQSPTVFWTFACDNLEAAKNFFDSRLQNTERLVVISSTGFFVHQDDFTVNESTAVDLENPRVQVEEWLRLQGACIIHAAGIYGPQRNPLDWYRRGMIRNLNKWLNLIHVQDLSRILIAAAEHKELQSMRLIAADSHPLLWTDIARQWIDASLPLSSGPRAGKRVDASRTLDLLKLQLQYPSLEAGLLELGERPKI